MYTTAVKIKSNEALAWQGLVSLCEKQGDKALQQYHNAAFNLAKIYMDIDDRGKCQAVVDNYVKHVKQFGSHAQYRRALELLLPSTPFYDFLEGRIWHPSFTYARIAEIIEREETEKINTLIGQRRTRLGAKIDQVTLDVRREVWADSQLEDIYGAILDWANDENETRRQIEEKLLRHAYDHLAALQGSEKPQKLAKVQKVADGLVILKHPFPLAWSTVLEWKDVERLGDLDSSLLREYAELFEDHGLSKVIRGYLSSGISPFLGIKGEEQNEADGEEKAAPTSIEDVLLLMTEGLGESDDSVLAHRMMTDYYLAIEEYQSAVETARKANKALDKQTAISGLPLSENRDAINTSLATALIYHQAPRNHPEARLIFNNILQRKPFDTPALIGVGLILEEQEHYDKALAFFQQALERTSDPKIKAEAAWCKALNGELQAGLEILEECLSNLKSSPSPSKHLVSETLYRIGSCLWEMDTSKKARRNREGAYARFLSSVQANVNFAPAYTRLGFYYSDYAKDSKRARKCFQKAFELSPSEVEAAEQLAKIFATTKEWDMVELVSQRVIDSGKCRPSPGSKKKGFSWPYAALGVVHLNSQAYQKSIVSYQAALRISPDDFNSWLGLGEGYASYGRYVAATGALERAIKLRQDNETETEGDLWFAEYLLGTVKRQLGDYEDAIALYRKVLDRKPMDPVVTISLLETLIEGAGRNIELGFVRRAAAMGVESLSEAMKAARQISCNSSFWKAFGDACSLFASAQSYLTTVPAKEIVDFVTCRKEVDAYAILDDVDGVKAEVLREVNVSDDDQGRLNALLITAILAQKLAVYEASNDRYAQASAWYNLGWAEYHGHMYKLDNARDLHTRKAPRFLKAAIKCFKGAIEHEAGNADFWNALGVVTSDLNVEVAQHSFVRSLHINDGDPRTWTNYGILCFLNEDIELANEALGRAQSADPDYALAWLAQGLVALRYGDAGEARNLFTHALEIADASSPAIGRQYTQSKFDDLLCSSSKSSTEDLLTSMTTLLHIQYQTPNDAAVQYLSALFAERVGDFREAEKNLDTLSAKLEQDYEASESAQTLERFVLVKASLARVSLALQEYDNAFQHATTCIDLSGGEDAEDEEYRQARWSARVCAALVWLHEDNKADALKELGYLIEEGNYDPELSCLRAQVLWAEGSQSSKTAARNDLLATAEKHPGHVGVTMLLGAIALIDDDRDTAEAVADDLRSLQMSENIDLQQLGKIENLLAATAAIGIEGSERTVCAATEAKKTIMLVSWRPHGWSQLTATGHGGHTAEMAVLNATKSVPPAGSLDADGLCRTYAATKSCEDAQKGIMVAPWNITGWETLRDIAK